MLSFVVSDMLALAQLNSDKFRKNSEVFDIKEAVEEIISILHDKVNLKKIKLAVKYVGFSEGYKVCTDEHRL